MYHLRHKSIISISTVLALLSVVFTYYFLSNYTNQKAYADGLTQENLPPASVGNRKASLFVKVNPPILTTDNRQDAYMQFRLFDANNNQTIQHVTYEITVNKGTLLSFSSSSSSSSSSLSGQKPLLRDFF